MFYLLFLFFASLFSQRVVVIMAQRLITTVGEQLF